MLTRSVSAVCFFSAVAHITYLRHHPSLSYNCLQLSSLLSVHLIVQRYFSVTASTGQNGLQSCPKCQAPLQDWISLQEAQSNPSLVSYFQSVDTMLSKLTLAIRVRDKLSLLARQDVLGSRILNVFSTKLRICASKPHTTRASHISKALH